MNPGMLHVWNAVKLKHDGLPGFGFGEHAGEMLGTPIRIGIAGRGNQQPVVAAGVESRTELQRSVLRLRRFTAPGQPVSNVSQDLYRFRAEEVSAVGEAHWF